MKFFRKIHLWMTVPFGIFITLICFSGAMLIFEQEITRSVRHDVYYTGDHSGEALPMADVMKGVAATLPDSVSITGVTVFPDKDRCWQVNLSKPRRASLFVNQYTGQITGKYERLPFFSTMFKLHRWLCDSANPKGDGIKTGKLLVGISTIIFILALITGIVIWTPIARKGFWKSLRVSVSKGWPFFWKTLHVGGGMWVLLFVLAMALTGLNYSFDWYRKGFYAIFGVEMKPRNMGGNDNGAPKGNRHGGDGKGEKAGVSVDSVAEPTIQLAEASAPAGEGADRVARENRKPERKSDGQSAPAAEEKSAPAREAGDAAAEETGRHGREGRERRGEGHEGREGRGEGRGEGREGRGGRGEGRRGDGEGYRRHRESSDSSAAAAVASVVADSLVADNSTAAKTTEDAPKPKTRTAASGERSGRPDKKQGDARSGKQGEDRWKGHDGERNEVRDGRHGDGNNRPEGHEGRHGRDGRGNGDSNGGRHGADSREAEAIDFSCWGNVLAEMEAKYPSAPQITIGNGTASASLGNFGNARASDKYSFEAADGVLTPSNLYASAERADKLRGWIYAFHTGTPLGIVTRIIWFLSALLGASLPLTGYYIWIRRLVLKRRGARARAAGTKK